MPRTVTLSTRVDERFRDEIDLLAQALGRDRAWIVEQALKRFIEAENAFIAAVRQGQEDIRAGRFITDEEMNTELDRIETEFSPHQ